MSHARGALDPADIEVSIRKDTNQNWCGKEYYVELHPKGNAGVILSSRKYKEKTGRGRSAAAVIINGLGSLMVISVASIVVPAHVEDSMGNKLAKNTASKLINTCGDKVYKKALAFAEEQRQKLQTALAERRLVLVSPKSEVTLLEKGSRPGPVVPPTEVFAKTGNTSRTLASRQAPTLAPAPELPFEENDDWYDQPMRH